MQQTILKACDQIYLHTGMSRLNSLLHPDRVPVTILYYHEVRPCQRRSFEQHIEYLKGNFHVVDLRTAVDAIKAKARERLVAINFDDAFSCLRTDAFPVLRRHRIPATIFMPTGLAGQLPRALSETPENLREMRIMTLDEMALEQDDLVDFQAHSHAHQSLYTLSEDELDADFSANKNALAAMLGKRSWAIPYPHGDLDDVIRRVTARHFEVGLGSLPGIGQSGDLFDLRRINLSDMPDIDELRRRLAGCSDWRSIYLRRRRSTARRTRADLAVEVQHAQDES